MLNSRPASLAASELTTTTPVSERSAASVAASQGPVLGEEWNSDDPEEVFRLYRANWQILLHNKPGWLANLHRSQPQAHSICKRASATPSTGLASRTGISPSRRTFRSTRGPVSSSAPMPTTSSTIPTGRRLDRQAVLNLNPTSGTFGQSHPESRTTNPRQPAGWL